MLLKSFTYSNIQYYTKKNYERGIRFMLSSKRIDLLNNLLGMDNENESFLFIYLFIYLFNYLT